MTTRVLSGVPAQRTSTAAPAAAEDAGAATPLAEALLAQTEADAATLADALHDGVLQSLVVARYASDAAVRGADPLVARDAVQDALVALRRLVSELRPRTGDGLGPALQDLATRRVAAGSAPLRLDLDAPAAQALPATAAAVAYRLVQRACTSQPVPLTVSVRMADAEDAVLVELDAQVPDAAAEALRARSVGGSFAVHDTGASLRLPLPRPLREELP